MFGLVNSYSICLSAIMAASVPLAATRRENTISGRRSLPSASAYWLSVIHTLLEGCDVVSAGIPFVMFVLWSPKRSTATGAMSQLL